MKNPDIIWRKKKSTIALPQAVHSSIAENISSNLIQAGMYVPDFDNLWGENYSKEKKRMLFFINTPKTASTSINRSRIYDEGRLIHAKDALNKQKQEYEKLHTIEEVREYLSSELALKKKHQNAVPFTVVRNPFTWFRSLYTHNTYPWRLIRRNKFTFKAAVMAWCDPCIEIEDIIQKPSSHFMFKSLRNGLFDHLFKENVCDVPIIIRFEWINLCYRILTQELGLNVEGNNSVTLEKLTSSRSNPDNFNWDLEMVETFGKFYKKELQMFGYNFEGPIDNSIFINPNLVKP